MVAAFIPTAFQASAATPKPERIALWPRQAPVGGGETEEANAFITVYRPAQPNGAAVVICPGGGYRNLVKGAEGAGIAEWLNRHGILGVVLEYRLPKGNAYRPLCDAQRAIRTVRTNARKWGCDPARIGIIGFSAGGHLASTAATHFDNGEPGTEDPVDRVGSRPDFAILIYPVISMGPATHAGSMKNLLGEHPAEGMAKLFSNEKQVTDQTPPVFLAHAADDRVVPPAHSQMFYDALRSHKVEAEYLKLPSGGHGLNRYSGPMWDAWQNRSLQWLVSQQMIPQKSAPRPVKKDQSKAP